MMAMKPDVVVPGDNDDEELTSDIRPRLMARAGNLMGMSKLNAVWRFGFSEESDFGRATGIYMEIPFLWVVSTRKTGRIRDYFFGPASELPVNFRKVIDWEP